ncbi:MAG: type I restriction enzyme HsdR N-terminal domain-containing protein [Gallionella sp.]
MAISKKVTERITTQVKRFQSILSEAKDRDISESDTVVIIGDMLSEMLGYKKYTEITTEFAIRGTYCDLAVKVDSSVRFLIEAKAVGIDLKDNHIKQAIDYGANHGIEWVILTNGVNWQVYKIHFRQPIDKSLIFEIDILQASPRNPQLLECFGNLSREGFTQSSMTAFFQQQQATSKFSLAALLTSESMLQALRKEIRKISSTIKVEEDFLKFVLQNDVIKRELIDSEDAKQAAEFLKKAARATAKAKSKELKPTEPEISDPQPPSVN